MKLAQVLTLVFAPAVLGDCVVDFPRNASDPTTPANTTWPTTVEGLGALVLGLEGDTYGLWSTVFATVTGNNNCLGFTGSPQENAQDTGGLAMMCLSSNSPICQNYRTSGQSDCQTIPTILPDDICIPIPECVDLYTTALGAGNTQISLKFTGGTSEAARQLTVYGQYGCIGTTLMQMPAQTEGACQPFPPPQTFNIRVYAGPNRQFQAYANNILQQSINLLICGATYQTNCLGTAAANASSPTYASCLQGGSCALLNNNTCFGDSGSDSSSDDGSDGFTLAPVTLLAVGALLF